MRAILALLILLAGLATAPARAGAAVPVELRGATPLSSRLTELRVFSPALGRETSLRVLTPADFDPARDRLPVLWLLHGGFGSQADWTTQGDAEALTAGLPLIVVMPDGGQGGWYSDWRTVETTQGFQRWETYQVDELRPFIESLYKTRTDRAGHGIAGLSMGGFGALHHAARHPDRYAFVAGFSGAVDNRHPGVTGIAYVSPLIMGGRPGDIWGDPVLHETTWRANDPVDLAANLRTLAIELRTGNGEPGPYGGASFDAGEAAVAEANASLQQRLAALAIPHVYDVAPGSHSWPYWREDLAASLPAFLTVAAAQRPDPLRVDHVAWEPAFSVWGHDVSLDRVDLEPVVLSLGRDGFVLSGRGRGHVVTPARYCPGERVVVVTTRRGAQRRATLVAGPDGRLAVPVSLGATAVPGATAAVQATLWPPARSRCPAARAAR